MDHWQYPNYYSAGKYAYKKHWLIVEHINNSSIESNYVIGKMMLRILRLHPLLKIPLLLVLCLPVLVIIACLLLIFDQKPDSMIRAFTDTYHHGLSQLGLYVQKCEMRRPLLVFGSRKRP